MTLDRILEITQDLSGLAFSSFLFVHLASPVGAAIVGREGSSESIASSIQLAGRVVYRDGRLREAILVWIPLGTHFLVGLVRRVTRLNRQRRIRAQLELRAQLAEDLPPSGRRLARAAPKQSTLRWLKSYLPTTSHAIAGYIAIPFLLDHIFSHRLSASPSLRSFQFVSFNLQHSPVLASIKYVCLLSTSLYHSLVGLDQVFSRLLPSSPPKRKSISDSQRSLSVCLGWLGIVGTVGLGIRKLAREPIPLWMARRYQ
ncbi:uncharacterized protein PGTG_01190 [Puccinia graminis f. sp. tritici CRL 75-36-700-3]|uniref:Mitochondrial adapter protein MCP1 transmembrane domain-containing protein n=1 Tax=Puccinia graminis f. sp. tritici (strain CRL 75-36-700-3 / race SCCL) TaxID=418459 RepID=E3JUY4_PUCGT|nr:uncharacterized protein PGTG_01190 [Puccinia graminis f. sp. tritici CRL 75-36-700-3]EFP75859.1 hypothetical protein PGTG_01190 [Puccinia graminis f. sp. tritici CRL 75-36-700-3]